MPQGTSLHNLTKRLRVLQPALEYVPLGRATKVRREQLGLGAVNPRTDTVESPRQIRAAVERALQLHAPDRIFLNPNCGLEPFSSSSTIAAAKLRAMVAAARDLRTDERHS